MLPHCVGTDPELPRDFLVGQALRDLPGDHQFALGQELGHRALGDSRRRRFLRNDDEDLAATADAADHVLPHRGHRAVAQLDPVTERNRRQVVAVEAERDSYIVRAGRRPDGDLLLHRHVCPPFKACP
jgi:hypothetical protein